MEANYHKICDTLYAPYGETNEILHTDRIIYITYLTMNEVKKNNTVIDITYGLYSWLSLDKSDYIIKVRKKSYRVIGEESLKKYLKTNYDIDYH